MIAIGSGAVPVSHTQAIGPLSPGTAYKFCAMANNANGTNKGNTWSFTTTNGPAPQPRYGLVPCGVDRDNPDTLSWNEKDPCELKHTFLLIKNLIDFALWKLVPLIIAILVVATGAIFYFSLGSANTLATVRRIWRYVGMGVLILMFSWLFLNFLLGILGFDVNIFGRWTEITV